MTQESTKEQKDSSSRNPHNLTYYEPAKKLVDETFAGEGSDPFLKIMASLRQAIRHGSPLDLDMATMNLLVAAFSHSDRYIDVIESYALSLLDEPDESSGKEKSISEKASGIVDSIILLMTDERLTEEFRKRLAHAATEMMNDLSKSEEVLFAWLRSHFDESRERIAKASAPEESHLTDSSEKVLKIDEWAITNRRTPSPKLDLMAALVDVEDELIIEAMFVALQGKGGTV